MIKMWNFRYFFEIFWTSNFIWIPSRPSGCEIGTYFNFDFSWNFPILFITKPSEDITHAGVVWKLSTFLTWYFSISNIIFLHTQQSGCTLPGLNFLALWSTKKSISTIRSEIIFDKKSLQRYRLLLYTIANLSAENYGLFGNLITEKKLSSILCSSCLLQPRRLFLFRSASENGMFKLWKFFGRLKNIIGAQKRVWWAL